MFDETKGEEMLRRLAVLSVGAIVALAIVVGFAPASDSASGRVTPGLLEVPPSGRIVLEFYNPTTKSLTFSVDLHDTLGSSWSSTSQSTSIAPDNDAHATFTCNSVATACPAAPIISAAKLVVRGGYDSALAGYFVEFDPTSFQKI